MINILCNIALKDSISIKSCYATKFLGDERLRI